MKRTFSLLTVLCLSNAYAITPQQEAQAYGQSVLRVYAAQGAKNKLTQMTDKDCSELVQLATPTGQSQQSAIRRCTLHIWGKQATAEILYEVAGNPMNNWRRIWVGQMRGLPSDAQAEALGQALAAESAAWVSSPAGKAWFARQNKKRPVVMYGYRLDCAVFSKTKLPAGVKSCFEGPGPADGPTITLQMADGRSFSVGVR